MLTDSHRVPIRVIACALVGKAMRRSPVGVGPSVRNAIVNLNRSMLYIYIPRVHIGYQNLAELGH